MAMTWQGEEARYQQLCQVFSLASSPDNAIQQQVMQFLNQVSQLPDFNLYLATIFAQMRGQDEVVRQRAGLLLKTNLARQLQPGGENVPQAVTDYVQVQCLTAVRDTSKVIRHTAGTVITTLVQRLGVAACNQALDQLANCLSDPNPDIVEGSFNALNKICEDGVTLLKQLWDAPDVGGPFVRWSTEKLLPRVFQYASPNAPVHARQNAIECLNHFALNYLFNKSKFPQLDAMGPKYVEVLGVLANDQDVVVLKAVCKGFVCVIENEWDCLSEPIAKEVLQYMFKACQHPEYGIRQEALEVWTACTNLPTMCLLVRPMLPQLVPVLLANMVYSQADYMSMEQAQLDDDNAQVPDQAEDIKPRIHKDSSHGGAADDDDEEEPGQKNGGAWGALWTARKAAANALDHLANTYSEDILKVVLPLIQQKLEDSNWEVQESGVLALGAIAMGCWSLLVPFLPRVLELLLRLCQAEKPLLRSISCWACCRFASWICDRDNPCQEQVLKSVLTALLQRVLDKNKRCQEAACSAFATLEEQAGPLLVAYLDDIVRTLCRAFQYYQAKNMLILYDAIGTLAEAVGSALDKPQYVQPLLEAVAQKFQATPDNDRSLCALLECLGHLAKNLGPGILPLVPVVVQRCMRLIANGSRAAQMWQQNPNEYEKPDREVTAACIDFLAGLVEGFRERTHEVVAQYNFIAVLPEILKDSALNVKQSAFALVGDTAKFSIQSLAPVLPQVIPLACQALRENNSINVQNNASWSIGEICIKVGGEFLGPYLENIVTSLVQLLQRHSVGGAFPLLVNLSITLGRLGMVCSDQMGKRLPEFALIWCRVMQNARNDEEKVNAFQGLCLMIKANPQACMNCVPDLFGAVCSFFPHVPPTLQPMFKEILAGYKQSLGANWAAAYGQMHDIVKNRAQHLYQIGA